jgi:lipoate-protein ligase A
MVKMLYVYIENGFDPYINFAIEEHLLRNFVTDENILFLYINEPSIIIGRHQNAIEEINQDFVETNHIHVVRRLSGGGAVYHDHGNLNYSIITKKSAENVHNFRKFAEPVVKALNAMDVPAVLSGRNDILVQNRKVSGNAQYVTTQRMVHHGTLLYNTDLSRLSKALNITPQKIISKSIKSVRSAVANISEFLPEPIDIESFRLRLLHELRFEDSQITSHSLTPKEWETVECLANERYRTWGWNYGHSPDFTVQKSKLIPGGFIDASIEIQHGLISKIALSCGLARGNTIENIEQRLIGIRYNRSDVAAALQELGGREYPDGLSEDELVAFLA